MALKLVKVLNFLGGIYHGILTGNVIMYNCTRYLRFVRACMQQIREVETRHAWPIHSWVKPQLLTILVKPTERYFPVVLSVCQICCTGWF